MAEAKVQGFPLSAIQGSNKDEAPKRIGLDRVTTAMAESAAFAASLLAGEMPENIEEASRNAMRPSSRLRGRLGNIVHLP